MSIKSYHIIDLPDGSTTDGQVDRRPDPAYCGLEHCGLLRGARVLDVGAFDGVWAFWAEKAGAGYVLATDVEEVARYDWGWAGPPEKLRTRPPQSKFYEIKKALDSKVERKQLTVYDLDPKTEGEFDLIVFYGLLYHLRHPLLAFDRLRAVCRGAIVVETHSPETADKVPFMLFYPDDVLANTLTNWCGPSEACVVQWMLNAGFTRVFYENPTTNRRRQRKRFLGAVDDEWAAVFSENKNFKEVTAEYLNESRRLTERLLQGDETAWRREQSRQRPWRPFSRRD